MRPLTRRERIAAALWVVIGIVVWNGIYDFVLTRAVNLYLFRASQHEAGRGPAVSMPDIMDYAVYDAIWMSTMWACAIVLAGLLTLRMSSRQ
jgi:hypothetical protein